MCVCLGLKHLCFVSVVVMQSYPGEINIGDCERVAPASLFFLIFFENLSEITVVRGKIHSGVRILRLFYYNFVFVFS